MTVVLILLGLVLLLCGGAAVVSGASGLAARFGVSPLMIGLTVVAFGTSAPELVVNLLASARGASALAFGNVAGSNLANLALVLGAAALISPVTIQGQIVRRELPLLLLGTCVLAIMIWDRVLLGSTPVLSRSDGLILLLLFSIFIYFTVMDFIRTREDPLLDNMRELEQSLPGSLLGPTWTDSLALIGGLVALSLGGHLTISSGSELAVSLGVAPVIIGLIVVAIGTSMPELVTSVVAALKNEPDLCVGNVIGSNIFNALVVLPLSALIRPVPIPNRGLNDVLVSLLFATLIVVVFYWRRGRMDRLLGALFIGAYLGYMTFRVTA